MTNLWVKFSTDSSGSFTELSGNIIYNVNNLYNFNGNLVDTSSNFIIYELTNNPIQANVTLQDTNWKQLNLNTILNPFQGYWLGGINTNLPQIFTDGGQLRVEVDNWIGNAIPIANNYGLIENWDVGNVTNMSGMFFNSNFNGNISNWDVGNVTDMIFMFFMATSFNRDLNEWDVGNVTDMGSMFTTANNFNGNISSWNVGNVTSMALMFKEASNFNQDLNEWNVGNVTRMDSMFLNANSFNQDIRNWDVGNVTNMDSMFSEATNFNGNITSWDVGNVTNMSAMFQGASNFNGNISSWDVGNVINMGSMFLNANSFNQDIRNWDVGNVAYGNFNEMFKNVTFFTDISNQIHANGTPYNYFRSQTNEPIYVNIRSYFIVNYPNINQPILILSERDSDGEDSDFNRIKRALSISNMNDLDNYSFTSSQDSTTRDILIASIIINESIIPNQEGNNFIYYTLSGENTDQSYYSVNGPYTLTFIKKT